MKFCWYTIHVSNIEKALSFYQDIIGLPLISRISPNENTEIAFLGEQDTKIELVYIKDQELQVNNSLNSIGFQVNSVDLLYDQLQDINYPIKTKPFQVTPNQKFMYILDYDNNLIQFNDHKSIK